MFNRVNSLVLIALLFVSAIAFAEDAVVIANKNISVSEISSSDLRDIFNGDKSTLGPGTHVAPVTLKGGPVHEAFLKTHLGKSDAAFRAAWRSQVFTGQGSMPKTFESEAAMIDYVAATPGAIGYVSKTTAHEKVKTLAVK